MCNVKRGVLGCFYIGSRSTRPRLWQGRKKGDVYIGRLIVHARAEDACEVSDVKGQGWLVTEFWERQSSRVENGLLKV